jgi:hypothetical protein
MADSPVKKGDMLIGLAIIAAIALSLLDKAGIVSFQGILAPQSAGPGAGRTRTPGSVTEQNLIPANTEPRAQYEVKPDEDVVKATESPWANKITVARGNSAREIQPNREYIYIRAGFGLKAGERVDITGWTLVNARGSRLFQAGNALIRVNSDRVTIPQAVRLFTTDGKFNYTPVTLGRGERAVVVTGSMPIQSPYAIPSFRVNKCMGYIENMKEYDFIPRISTSCTDPGRRPDIGTMEKSCFDFIRNMRSCHTPDMGPQRINGRLEYGYVDGVGGLSQRCKNYLATNFSYNACVAETAGDPDFFTNEWRIYLNQKNSLWGGDRESISLYDNQGLLVDTIDF